MALCPKGSMRISTESDLPPLFIDTWGWIALGDAKDPGFAAVTELRRAYVERRRIWVTTDYVLSETITRVFSRVRVDKAEQFCSGIFRERELGLLAVEPITSERFRAAYQLRVRFRDKPRISFTDLTSFVVMR